MKIQMFGDRNVFALGLDKDEYAYQICLFVDGKDLLEFKKGGEIYPYRWTYISELIEWLEINLSIITQEDAFPVVVDGESAIEMHMSSFDFDTADDVLLEKWYTLVNAWSFRHCWLSSRAGSFLAEIFFREVNGKIEISWDNSETYSEDDVEYCCKKGVYYLDIAEFKKVVTEFIDYYFSICNTKR